MLNPPDSHHLSAAIGWIGLGDLLEARAELEKIQPRFRETSDVLMVRYTLCSKGEKWAEAQMIAEALVKTQPQQADYWCWLAYAERRNPKSGIEQAQKTLEQAAILFPEEPTIPYNLACYAAQLGRLPEAREWLDKVLNSPHKEAFQKMMREDPDLEPLRKQ